jgi:hypothetical protein
VGAGADGVSGEEAGVAGGVDGVSVGVAVGSGVDGAVALVAAGDVVGGGVSGAAGGVAAGAVGFTAAGLVDDTGAGAVGAVAVPGDEVRGVSFPQASKRRLAARSRTRNAMNRPCIPTSSNPNRIRPSQRR